MISAARVWFPQDLYNKLQASKADTYRKLFDVAIPIAFKGLMHELINKGKIKSVDSLGYEISVIDYWNDAVCDNPETETYRYHQLAWDPDELKYSINNQAGRLRSTRHHAALGIGHVCVGNSSPEVWRFGNTLVVGTYDDDDERTAVPTLGSICTDLWWATLIEYERLVEIIGDAAAVNVYLSMHEHFIVRTQLPPGEYQLLSAGYHHDFTGLYKPPAYVDLTNIEPFFALEPK